MCRFAESLYNSHGVSQNFHIARASYTIYFVKSRRSRKKKWQPSRLLLEDITKDIFLFDHARKQVTTVAVLQLQFSGSTQTTKAVVTKS